MGGFKMTRPMRWLLLLLFSALMAATTSANFNRVFTEAGVQFVDADCYSRMTRVQRVVEAPFSRISHHDFENFPQGTNPHTTAPMDWAIALLAAILSPFSDNALDFAGAWISPLLGVLTIVALWAWGERERIPFRGAMLLLVSISPIVVQGFKLGRPDHQSLLLFLLACAVGLEHCLWQKPTIRRAMLWGVAWGLALWTSLYEPLIVFVLLFVVRAAMLRGTLLSRPWSVAFLTALAVFGLGVLFDGWRVAAQDPLVAEYFSRWAKSIGELAHLAPWSPQFLGWIGWLAPALPVLLGISWLRKRSSFAGLLFVLVLVTYGLTCWQLRWGSFFVLFTAIAFPFALAAIPKPAVAWTAYGIGLLPLSSQWDTLLFPDTNTRALHEEMRTDYALLHEVAEKLASEEPAPILAPWWLSPPLAYWSGQPCVAGSSHQSLPGTVDTAVFYTTTDPAVAEDILAKRNVRYVIAYEPSRVLSTSASILGEPPPARSLGATLYHAPQRAPEFLKIVFANAFFRVYEYTGFKPTAADSP